MRDRACDDCAVGKVSDAGAAQCTDCVAGKYMDSEGQITCRDCAVGHYCPVPGLATQTICAAGGFAPAPGGAVECTVCAPGQYMSLEGSTACVDCVKGFYCPPGRVFEEASEQTPCPVGMNSPKRARTCTKCPYEEWCVEGKCNEGHKGLACDMCLMNWYMDSVGKELG